MEGRDKILIILAIIASILITTSFLLMPKHRLKIASVYVGNLDENSSHVIHVKIYDAWNRLIFNKTIDMKPNKWTKFLISSEASKFWIEACATPGLYNATFVRGKFIFIQVQERKGTPYLVISSL